MKTIQKILIALIVVFTFLIASLQMMSQQELPDTLWSKDVEDMGYYTPNAIKFSPDGKYVYVDLDGKDRYSVLQFETLTGKLIREIPQSTREISLSPTGDTILLSGGPIVTWRSSKTGEILDTIMISGIEWTQCRALLTPNGKRIIVNPGRLGLDKPQILIYDIKTKKLLKSFAGRYNAADRLYISPDGKYLSFTDFRGTYSTAILIDLNTYEEVKIFEDPKKDDIWNLRFSPDGKMMLTGTPKHINLWDLKTLKLIKTLNYYNSKDVIDRGGILRIVYSNDFKYLIYSYYDQEDFNPNEIVVWNIEKDSVEYIYPFSGTKAIDISKDGYIASRAYVPGHGRILFLLRPKWKTTGVKENENSNFNYSYNNGNLKINFKEKLKVLPEINIYNISGKLIKSVSYNDIEFNNKSIELDINFLNTGVYLFEINLSNKHYTIKIMK